MEGVPFAYRIGESLFCPGCYEKAAETLKAVQNPEDPEVTIAAKSIKAEDVGIFICKGCKALKGASRFSGETVETIEIRKRGDLGGLQDMTEDCSDKVAFLGDFFSLRPTGRDEFFSKAGLSGFHVILRDLEDELRFVVNQLSEKRQKGLIIEKERQG